MGMRMHWAPCVAADRTIVSRQAEDSSAAPVHASAVSRRNAPGSVHSYLTIGFSIDAIKFAVRNPLPRMHTGPIPEHHRHWGHYAPAASVETRRVVVLASICEASARRSGPGVPPRNTWSPVPLSFNSPL